MVVGAIAAWIAGARRLAGALTLFVAVDVLVLPMIEPWLKAQPLWMLAPMVLLAVLLVINSLLTFLFGPEAAGHFVGAWLVRIGDLLLFGPFRAIRALLRLLRRQ